MATPGVAFDPLPLGRIVVPGLQEASSPDDNRGLTARRGLLRWPSSGPLLASMDWAACICQLCPRFDDGAALWHAIRQHQLEGVVAKRLNEPYRPGERTWIKRKNPAWPRYVAEREAAMCERRHRHDRIT